MEKINNAPLNLDIYGLFAFSQKDLKKGVHKFTFWMYHLIIDNCYTYKSVIKTNHLKHINAR